MFHPIDGLLIVIEVNIIAILKASNRNHGIIALVIRVQGNAVDDAVSHNHQERIFNWNTLQHKQSKKIFKIARATQRILWNKTIILS